MAEGEPVEQGAHEDQDHNHGQPGALNGGVIAQGDDTLTQQDAAVDGYGQSVALSLAALRKLSD